MTEERRVYTVYIGEKDPYDWTINTGKNILMPIVLKTCEELIEEGLEKKQAVRVEANIRNTLKAFDFWVKRENLQETLDKVMDWALDNEEYEMCSIIKKLEERLQNEDFSYR
jgi:glutamyl-tRNA reductase